MSLFHTTTTHPHARTQIHSREGRREHEQCHGPGINLFSKFEHLSERVQHTFARSKPARNKEIKIFRREGESKTKTFHSYRLLLPLLPLLPSFAIYTFLFSSLLLIFVQKNFCLEENRFSALVLCTRIYVFVPV